MVCILQSRQTKCKMGEKPKCLNLLIIVLFVNGIVFEGGMYSIFLNVLSGIFQGPVPRKMVKFNTGLNKVLLSKNI